MLLIVSEFGIRLTPASYECHVQIINDYDQKTTE